jgi:hypothetical protein
MSANESSPPSVVHMVTVPFNWDWGKKCELPFEIWLLHTQSHISSTITDPLVHHSCHFGQMIHALCQVHTLLNNSILCKVELAECSKESFTAKYCISLIIFSPAETEFCRERIEHRVFKQLLQMIPGLEKWVLGGSEEEVIHIADLVGLSGYPVPPWTSLLCILDPERCLKCKVG